MHPLKHCRPLQAAAFGLAVISTLAFSGLFTRQPAPRYTVTDLGVLPGHAVSQAVAVNSRGDVVGSADPLGSGSERAYLYQGGKLTEIGVLPGGSGSSAKDINSQGVVTGVAWLPNAHHAFLYSGGRMRDLGVPPGYTDSTGVGVSDRGEVAVDATSSVARPGLPGGHAFLYSGARMTDIVMPPGCSESRAGGISATGQVVGTCRLLSALRRQIRPFLYDSRTKAMTILPIPTPYIRGWAYQANGSGQVIGDVALPDGTCHAALWYGNRMTDLGTPPGYAVSLGSGLNSQGEAVGNCFENGTVKTFLRDHASANNPLRRYLDRDTEHAFVYRGGKIQDLNNLISKDADWTLEEARGINDRGQIVGRGLHHGLERAFLLTLR